MSTALPGSPPTYTPHGDQSFLEDDPSIGAVAKALLACHARGADDQTMLAMCERLLTVTEAELLGREARMMAVGHPELANLVRRHGDVLFTLGRQVRDARRRAAPLSATFIRFVESILERNASAQ